jgi:hypothetical protein
MVIPLDAVVVAVFHLCDFLIIEAQGAGDKVNGIRILDALRRYEFEDFPVAIALFAHCLALDCQFAHCLHGDYSYWLHGDFAMIEILPQLKPSGFVTNVTPIGYSYPQFISLI